MVNNFSKSDAPGINSKIVIAAAVVLVLFIGGLAYFFLAPHGEVVHPRPLTAEESWLQQKAKESKGDFAQLSPDDQKQLFQKLGPSAPVTLRMNYQAQQSK